MQIIISEVVDRANANVVRTVLHASGRVTTWTLDEKNVFRLVRTSSSLWGRVRYSAQYKALNKNVSYSY